MIVHQVTQGSLEWAILRASIPTASEFDRLVSPTGEIRKGQMPVTYLAMKLAEQWQGGPLPAFGSFAMEQGQLLESEAIPWLELEYGWALERPGFITTDDGKIGCSPDGLRAGGGVEIKCPEPTAHIQYLLGGVVPPDYVAQVQGGMLVTGLQKWTFVSYRRHFPAFVIDVEPDEKFQAALREALELFYVRFNLSMEYLIDKNGGQPPRSMVPLTPLPTKPANKTKPQPEDVIP